MGLLFIRELERTFQILNAELFSGNLKRPEFLMQPRKKVSLKYADTGHLVIGQQFKDVEYAELPVLMLHEMIHISNLQKGIVDCGANEYHKKEFLNIALKLGLFVIKHKTQGWAITTTTYPRNVVEPDSVRQPTPQAIQHLESVLDRIKFDKAVFREGRSDIANKSRGEKRPKNYFLKYICNCPPPHNSIRSGRRPDGPNALNIRCMNCNSNFVCVEE
jgi:hypothetical protein